MQVERPQSQAKITLHAQLLFFLEHMVAKEYPYLTPIIFNLLQNIYIMIEQSFSQALSKEKKLKL